MWQVTGDTWQVTRDMWHVTRDTWHATRDMWHMVGDEHSLKISALYLFWFEKDSVLKIFGLKDYLINQ